MAVHLADQMVGLLVESLVVPRAVHLAEHLVVRMVESLADKLVGQWV